MSAPRAAIRLSWDQLPLLLSVLQQELPLSFKVYGDLKTHLWGRWPAMTFWVDSWPDFKVVVSRAYLDCSEGSERGDMSSIGIFARNADVLPSVVEDVVDWDTFRDVTALEESLLPVTEKAGRDRGLKMTTSLKVHLYAVTRSSLVHWPVPEGFTLSPMGADHVDVVTRTWKYQRPGADKFVRNLLSALPSVCLHDNQGRMVGHELAYQQDSPGMLYVQSQFRGQGYGKVIVSELARRFLEENDMVFATVEEGNDSGRRVHEVCGFQKVPDFVCKWQFFDRE